MEKLIKIQNELKAPKNQFNNFGKYKYRSCEDILEALKPLLDKYSCTLTIGDEIDEIAGTPYVRATAMITDGETNITVSACAGIDINKKGMDVSQTFGSSSSYARKYALNGLFLIDDTKDADTPEKKEENDKKSIGFRIQEASKIIKESKTEGELAKIWNAYPELQNYETFIEVIKNQKNLIKNGTNKSIQQ